MSIYSEAQIADLMKELEAVAKKETSIVHRLLSFPFKTQKAEEYARHGLGRRIKSIAHSVRRVFEELPPGMNGLPDADSLEEATVHIQSVAFHAYGCFDNLAHIWVEERDVRHENGRELSPILIGFGEKCQQVLASLPTDLQKRLAELRPWMTFLEAFRHSSAHRIPLYIPPYVIDPRHLKEYGSLGLAQEAAARVPDWEEYDRLHDRQLAFATFRPMTATSLSAVKTALFHPQLLCDFATVEEWTRLTLDALQPSG